MMGGSGGPPLPHRSRVASSGSFVLCVPSLSLPCPRLTPSQPPSCALPTNGPFAGSRPRATACRGPSSPRGGSPSSPWWRRRRCTARGSPSPSRRLGCGTGRAGRGHARRRWTRGAATRSRGRGSPLRSPRPAVSGTVPNVANCCYPTLVLCTRFVSCLASRASASQCVVCCFFSQFGPLSGPISWNELSVYHISMLKQAQPPHPVQIRI